MSETRYLAKPRLKEILNQPDIKAKFPSQKDFAMAVGVREPTISRFDSQSRFDINTLISISKVLETSVEDLFYIEKNPNYVDIQSKYKKLDSMAQVFKILSDLPEEDKAAMFEMINHTGKKLSVSEFNTVLNRSEEIVDSEKIKPKLPSTIDNFSNESAILNKTIKINDNKDVLSVAESSGKYDIDLEPRYDGFNKSKSRDEIVKQFSDIVLDE